ncbi:type II toxin-antitoxin system RelB/DinJ family antitoxin [Moraxella sp. ZY210820]|uniref:type II toxin-antitoxin system RelB/DinJ family antitoxin n=1 Tax=unclassified Moraxella TaxID=2685852 RepID=UPI00273018E7|nr:type II toxin-antitoxin system RelB/DinJ family antitoxin [Moraxella sp. ZY210820]WLF84566.1 type II toxin-antitoxin system RelB/DinJ family antitoxin [Moraxella sp. ZY210820]
MTTNFNLRLDENLKAQAFGVIESFGMTPSQFMRLILKQVADTGSLPLSFEKRTMAITPNELTAQAIRQGRTDYQAGVLEKFEADNVIEALQELSCG